MDLMGVSSLQRGARKPLAKHFDSLASHLPPVATRPNRVVPPGASLGGLVKWGNAGVKFLGSQERSRNLKLTMVKLRSFPNRFNSYVKLLSFPNRFNYSMYRYV